MTISVPFDMQVAFCSWRATVLGIKQEATDGCNVLLRIFVI